MKKILTASLLACSFALLGAATIGCNDKKPQNSTSSFSSVSDSSASNVSKEARKVTFESGEGYTVSSNASITGSLTEGSQLIFELNVGAFYAGSPIAYVNDKQLLPDADGIFSYTVGTEDLNVRIEGIRKDVSNMSGSGTMEDAFVVTRPIDLIYIAEQVNAGNRAYSAASYILANDIDCKGEELKIIGDYSTQSSVFSGSFACDTDPNTLTRVPKTISNFTISTESDNYVGLFGAVFADGSVQSSALLYGIRLDNFVVNVGVNEIQGENKTVTCGALVGYGVGANMYLCDATNGEINVVADQNYFSFVGGLVGYQQGIFDEGYGLSYPSEISYSHVDVDVNILGGVALDAGGIVGYSTTNAPVGATAAIHNSYSLGSVTGALRSGGIVGGLGQYTVVSNCYAAGEITARSYQSASSPLITSDTYCHAYAGGIVGYAENDSIAHDSFFNGNVYAFTASGEKYEHLDTAIGGGDPKNTVSSTSDVYTAENCLYNVDLSDVTTIHKSLGWQDYNWNFGVNRLPLINYEPASDSVVLSLTVKYVVADETATITYNKKSQDSHVYFNTDIQSLNSYNPIGSFIGAEALPKYYQADNGVYRSYGYFFDEACTRKVPLSYMPMKDVILYVGFADTTPVVGSYQLYAQNSNEALTLEFKENGTVLYSDGSSLQTAVYAYDGEKLWIEGARLARYFDGDIVIDEEDTTLINDPNFDIYRYDFYDFIATISEGTLSVYDGVYFTAEDPLMAVPASKSIRGEYYLVENGTTSYFNFLGNSAIVEDVAQNGNSTVTTFAAVTVNGDTITLQGESTRTVSKSALCAYDEFKGSWVKSAAIDKVFTFDGISAWKYTYTVYERELSSMHHSCDEVVQESANGTYRVSGNQVQLFNTNGDLVYTAELTSDGYLTLSANGITQLYYANESYVGVWQGSEYELTLSGIRADGYGYATIVSVDNYVTELLYEAISANDVLAFYAPAADGVTKDYIYGYATYDRAYNILNFTLPGEGSDSGFVTDTLYLFDDYHGDWISDSDLLTEVEFTFNGLGLYSYLGLDDLSGNLMISENGDIFFLGYTLNSALESSFSYKGVTYVMTYDELNERIILSLGADGELQRKDEFAGEQLVDLQGKEYLLDGRSTLASGGTLTVDGIDYNYYPTQEGGNYKVVALGTQTEVGSIQRKSTHYLLTLNDATPVELYLSNEFMGDWAISGAYSLFEIGPTNLQGVIHATFKGTPVELTYLDPVTLTFRYRENQMPYTYYVYVEYDETRKENALVVSEYTNLALGDYIICSKADPLFSTEESIWEWQKDNGKTTLKFDGVTSSYANGCVELKLTLNHTFVLTDYFYSIKKAGIIMWSVEPMANRTWYFRIELLDESEWDSALADKEADIFVLRDENGEIKNVLRRSTVDGLYLTEAFDEEENKLIFDGNGMLRTYANEVMGEATYSYVIKSYNTDSTVTLEVVDLATNRKYAATLDYKDNTHVVLRLGEEIVD